MASRCFGFLRRWRPSSCGIWGFNGRRSAYFMSAAKLNLSGQSKQRFGLQGRHSLRECLWRAGLMGSGGIFSRCMSVNIVFVTHDGDRMEVSAEEGDSLLDVALDNEIPVEGACGGEMACSTCHMILEQGAFDALEEPTEEEEDMLDLAWSLSDTSRLGCQVVVTPGMNGMVIKLPGDTLNMLK